MHRTARIDASDERGADAPPGIGEGETDAEDGEPGVVALEVLGVAHGGEGEGVAVEGEGFGVGGVVGGGVVGDVVEGGFFDGHGCGEEGK